MPMLLLIRHGENNYVKTGRLAGRLSGVHLNQRGHQQAQELAERLKDAPIKAIYCSPLERAIETAEPLADKLALPIKVRHGLIETDYGEWQDQKVKGLSRLKLWKVVQHSPARMRFPGGESFADAQRRICSELDEICSLHDNKDMVACISHADPIKLAVAFYVGLPLDLFQRLTVSTASVTALQLDENGSRLLVLNYQSSLNFPV